MEKIYYSPQGYWKGWGAIKKLASKAKVSEHEAFEWLSRQEVWQIYLPPRKKIKRPHYQVDIPNKMHQADLLYLPHDDGYKYALTVIDVASRYKDAYALKTKKASEVCEALKKIYSRGPLTFPEIFQVDRGAEFKGCVLDLLAKHKTVIRRGTDHRHQCFVERFNRTLAERLFAYQYDKEMKESTRNKEWVERLPHVIEALNNEVTRLIKMKPKSAIKRKKIKQPENDDEEIEEIPPGAKVRYLYQPGEVENDEKKRATDPIWSLKTYDIQNKMDNLYYLKDGPKRSFVREELLVVPS